MTVRRIDLPPDAQPTRGVRPVCRDLRDSWRGAPWISTRHRFAVTGGVLAAVWLLLLLLLLIAHR